MRMEDIGKELLTILPADRIKTRYIDRVTYGSDAGFYYLLPAAVVNPVSEKEIISLFRFSHLHKVPLVFRTGGTSLSGQSITDGILIDLSRFWDRVQVEDNGRLVVVQPGITGAMVNTRLKKFSRKIGPDPSSINSAMMGGILSNNSSGMCCGVVNNAYHTIRHIRFILPDGNTFDTRQKEDYKRFEKECPGIAGELTALRKEIFGDRHLYEKIRYKYTTKNTVGYSLNAFIDYGHPLDILAHLLIGGEGTLAFIAEAVLETIPQFPLRSTALLYFKDLYGACAAINPLRNAGAEAVELMDRASLRAIENIRGMPAVIKDLPPPAAALLVEFEGEDQNRLRAKLDSFKTHQHDLSLLYSPEFTTRAEEQELLWKVRKGLFPSVGAVRKSGTTVILEDIAFPVDRLGDALTDLQSLFADFEYTNAIIFGHAKDGNIHFVITQAFNSQADLVRYDRFIKKIVELVVVRYDGSLKGEHGTGRNMASFVEAEWGKEAHSIMKRLKNCIDPENLLNPDVIISGDSNIHIRDVKQLPSVEQEVDKCIECGYCEHVCPSRDLTMTPRRRIVARRVLKMLELKGDKTGYNTLLQQYQYDGMETCAVDGLCATACPVDINTGDLVKRLRREDHSPTGNRMALFIARHFAAAEWTVRVGLKTGATINRVFGGGAMTRLTQFFRRFAPRMPLWPSNLGPVPVIPRVTAGPVPAPSLSNDPNVDPRRDIARVAGSDRQVIYFPACVSRIMTQSGGGNVMDAMTSVSRKSGIGLILPEDIRGACCGQLFSSKGYYDAFRFTCNRIIARLWDITREGRIPVVTDVSSCTYTMLHFREQLDGENRQRYDKMRIIDSVDYLHDLVLPLSGEVQRVEDIVLHPVCSLHKMGTYHKLLTVARHFASSVTVPTQAGCCGMAGDRGFLFPELTASATQREALEVRAKEYHGYYSSAVTCELALSQAVRKNYESILFLADRAIKENFF
jgi:D-lactate dehydrogenase